jgi:hypothetical protein
MGEHPSTRLPGRQSAAHQSWPSLRNTYC